MNRHTTLRLSLLLACAAPSVALAQTAYLEQSAVVGVGKMISISRLPVASASGAITYWDGTINLAVSPSGVPSLTTSPLFVKSPKLATDHLKAGQYWVKVGGCATQLATVTSGVGAGGSTVWTLLLSGPNVCAGYPNQATWQTGTPAPDVAARLTAAKVINDPDYSYGLTNIGGGGGCCGGFSGNNGLLAAEQINDQLELISYTDVYGQDQPEQTGSIVFGLCENASCSNAPA